MISKYILSLDSTSKELEDKFIKYLNDNGFGYWKWINNTYLILYNDSLSTKEITDIVSSHFPDVYFIINHIKIIDWYAYGPGKGENNMFTWLNNNWM